MSKRFKLRTIQKGELLFHLGDEGNEMIIVLDGKIECAIPKQEDEKGREYKLLENSWQKLVQNSLKGEKFSFVGSGSGFLTGGERDEALRLIKATYPPSV
jgi:hypothetical protein